LTYVPAESSPYQVTNRDNWWVLAERPEVKTAGMTANDLCYYNFKTRSPSEINWYLHYKVGCRRATRDGKNYMFTTGDRPGIVYLPKIGPPPPVKTILPKTTSGQSNAWFGVAGNAGTQFVIVGIDTLEGFVASLDDVGKGMAIHATTNRVGPGWGASGGVNFVYVTGISAPGELSGHQQLDPDFNLALGPNWGKVGKGAAKIKKLQPLIDVVKKIGAKSPSGLKKALGTDPDKWVELIKAGRSVKEYLGIDPHGEANVFTFSVPFLGAGVEASVFYGLSNFEAVWDFSQ